ncbi:MAG: DUF3160 domain-containing protein [Planctomycetes bacterium]|nr:DUF3160 domain-containing protein [Planctomycetota bacterium]
MGLRGPVVFALLAVAASAQYWPEELPAAGREALLKDGVWVGPKEFRQVFEAYNDPPCTIFVTTDGPIVAGYRLMERTVMRMERWSFAQMPRGLRELEAKLGKAERSLELPADTAEAAARRARLVVAVARLLLGEEPAGLDDATLAQARECAALVERAAGVSMPPGLGPPDPEWQGLDWRVFRPRGAYAGDDRYERAFRATRWLQSVPFRFERAEEADAFRLLHAARESADRGRGGQRLEPSPMWATRLFRTTVNAWVYDDGWWLAPAFQPGTHSLRFVPEAALPEDATFRDLLDPGGRSPIVGAGFPCGLVVATALGSPLAREALAPHNLGKIARDSSGPGWIAASNRMRMALLDPAEPDAPALFSSAAWQRKSLRTALGSWALERNVWTLHSPPVTSAREPKTLAGLVEPDPDAFAALAAMGRVILAWMEESELDGEAMRIEYADGVLAYARASVRSILDPQSNPALTPSPENLLRSLRDQGALGDPEYQRISTDAQRQIVESATSGGDVKQEVRRALLEPMLAACERWHARMTDPFARVDGPARGRPMRPEWERWIDLCTRLELLAHRQLRQREWSDEDAAFLEGYGVALGKIMGYSPGSVRLPVDDAPRAAAVICDPVNEVMRIVGTGRLRELWVLYPRRDSRIACRGVVLSYYELDAKEAPTDAEWKAMLDSKEPPPEPPWITGR